MEIKQLLEKLDIYLLEHALDNKQSGKHVPFEKFDYDYEKAVNAYIDKYKDFHGKPPLQYTKNVFSFNVKLNGTAKTLSFSLLMGNRNMGIVHMISKHGEVFTRKAFVKIKNILESHGQKPRHHKNLDNRRDDMMYYVISAKDLPEYTTNKPYLLVVVGVQNSANSLTYLHTVYDIDSRTAKQYVD